MTIKKNSWKVIKVKELTVVKQAFRDKIIKFLKIKLKNQLKIFKNTLASIVLVSPLCVIGYLTFYLVTKTLKLLCPHLVV